MVFSLFIVAIAVVGHLSDRGGIIARADFDPCPRRPIRLVAIHEVYPEFVRGPTAYLP